MILPRRRFLALSACALVLPAAAAPTRHHWQGVALGADVALTVEGGTPAAARAFFAEAERALRSVERQFSLFGGSELMRLNALGRLAHPSDDMLALLDLAGRVHAATGGAFDPTVQPLWQARRLGQDEAPALALVGWEGLRAGSAEIRLARPGMALTLNGIAQGFAADRLAAAVEEGGYLVYTGQPWHPQLELIARALTSHRQGQAWVMRRRSQAEMDQLVEAAGFRKLEQRIDEWGIFSVSLAQRVS
mgnify:CR=1 FL=1